MLVEQRVWSSDAGWELLHTDGPGVRPPDSWQLVIFFAAPRTLDDGHRFRELKEFYPSARIVGCTTGGEIFGDEAHDDTIIATAIHFERTHIEIVQAPIGTDEDSFKVGAELGLALPKPELRGVFVLSDGTRVNGTSLIAGLQRALGQDAAIAGGLAGDGADFGSTRVGVDANPEPGRVAAIGFYGDAIRLGYGSYGGWDTVGPERIITRSQGNLLFDLDGTSALELYKQYLGNEAANLPASALLFPLRIHPQDRPDMSLVRTVVGVDQVENTMVFAGDVPQGHVAQVMLGYFEHLVAGAGQAAERGILPDAQLAILVSCIGRKLLMGQRISDEVEAVAGVLGPRCRLTGFYSYGEIAPHEASPMCVLHNQTMTIMTMAEV